MNISDVGAAVGAAVSAAAQWLGLSQELSAQSLQSLQSPTSLALLAAVLLCSYLLLRNPKAKINPAEGFVVLAACLQEHSKAQLIAMVAPSL
ncbi:hypothetical protein B484DRAFT_402086 [Ochromonadaceae sp. CCMP2298]|nr:hypothetical protein B484DRAFT_402086 [Ochromonadaceae sp. CCMP2298]